MTEWRDVAVLRAWLLHDGEIDGEALLIRSFLARLDRAPALDADRVETAARVLHDRRHRFGTAPTCGACRDDAAAVAAVLTASSDIGETP